ncbi:MAG: RsmB/NOP family class I SAM-dependent RNA methyltransferase [Nanoarchaeota archaeon]|nr:RsmB/NOP family class I SAM-dependent RNA methyltransferase [Nanoarchaeota archaeon]MBU4116591.1 RsmB/NOP family class I SAM-dependent RNA methyltransferase [Nanoarchaeota archaeon]
MTTRKRPELKPLFVERMKSLLVNQKDFENYMNILKVLPVKSIRCNLLKISPKELKEKLEKKGWNIQIPWEKYPEIMIVQSDLEPGELGRAKEHLLGDYYVQELASMLPIIALKPQPEDIILDLCSAPGSKTTQACSKMNNTGTIIANEVSLGRIKILASNLERCGVANTIITKKDGVAFCKRIKKMEIEFDKILVDAPCSGEGTLRSSPKTYVMWNIKTIKNLPRIQKNLVTSALEILKSGGELIYSTCTHAPEENEGVVDYLLKEFKGKIKLEKIELPIKAREGITGWQEKKFSPEIKKCVRVYPQDNNTEGFFLAKFKKLK